MLKKKQFKAGFVLNAVVWLLLITTAHITESNQQDSIFYLGFTSILTAIVIFFTAACFSLYKRYDTEAGLTKEGKISGTIISVIYSLLIFLFLVCLIDMTEEIFTYTLNIEPEAILFYSLFCCFLITSVYVNIGYWVIRTRLGNRVSNL